jgi:hypothetical protein
MPSIKVNKFSRSKVPFVFDPIPEEQHNQIQVEDERIETLTQDEVLDMSNIYPNNENDLFGDLTNVNYISEEINKKEAKTEKERIKIEKEQHKLDVAKSKEEERKKKLELKEMEILNKKSSKVAKVNLDTNELFASDPDELMGLTKRQLLKKISEYRNLFPSQLKSFKIKKNPSEDDLKAVLAEFEAIVSTDSVEGFALEAILSCITITEAVSTRTKWNITGTAELLKQNEKFSNLCKQLFLKHRVFSNVSVEMQLVLCVGMTAMIAKQNNDKRKVVDSFLNATV